MQADLTPHDLPMWTIYANPSDYPGRFVVRRFVIRQGGHITQDAAPLAVVGTLGAAREALPHERGLVLMPRQPGDEPQIVESWI